MEDKSIPEGGRNEKLQADMSVENTEIVNNTENLEKTYKGNAKDTPTAAKAGEENVKDSQTVAKADEGNVKDSQTVAKADEGNVKDSQTVAKADEGSVKDSQTVAKADEGNVKDSQTVAKADMETVEDEKIPPMNRSITENLQAVPLSPDIVKDVRAIQMNDQGIVEDIQTTENRRIVEDLLVTRNDSEIVEVLEVIPTEKKDALVKQQQEEKLPSSQKTYSWLERIKRQSTPWKNHFDQYFIAFVTIMVLMIILITIYVEAFLSREKKFGWHLTAECLIFGIFLVFWLCTPEGPPFISTVDGRSCEAEYTDQIIEL